MSQLELIVEEQNDATYRAVDADGRVVFADIPAACFETIPLLLAQRLIEQGVNLTTLLTVRRRGADTVWAQAHLARIAAALEGSA